MSNLYYGAGFLTTPPPGSLVVGTTLGWMTHVAGYVAPMIKVPQIVEEAASISRLKDTSGIVFGVIDPNDCILKCTFSYIPVGGTTRAQALTSATLPPHGPVGIKNLPVIPVGPFGDSFNSPGTGGLSSNPWFYFGEGEIIGAEEGKEWTGSITLWRFAGITSGTAFV